MAAMSEGPRDTIAQVATPVGEGGLAVIRLSGPETRRIMGAILRNEAGTAIDMQPRFAHHGYVFDPEAGEAVDEVVATFFPAGRSFTGEDMAEISCHAGRIVAQRVLDVLRRQGARLAEPGEFSKRAFLNGRIDLAQAEAICDLVRAKSEEAARAALRQLRGGLSRRLAEIREKLLQLVVDIEAAVDFPEDDITPIDPARVRREVAEGLEAVEGLLKRAGAGRALREGTVVAIVGRPNVGKSSILNALLGRDRAIVTPMPGTTRDTLEEFASIGGWPFCLIDTAGLRERPEEIEAAGIQRALAALETCDVCLAVFDGSEPLDEEDEQVAQAVRERGAPTIAALNKSDLEQVVSVEQIAALLPEARVVRSCAVRADGVEEIEAALVAAVSAPEGAGGEPEILTNARHIEALERARERLRGALSALDSGLALDLVSLDVREALSHMGEITGETVTPELIDRIFETFCLGK